MWLFSSPQNYREMLNKIAMSIFFITIIEMYILIHISDKFNSFISLLSLGLEFECEIYGINIYIAFAILYIPLVIAILENIYKLHDKVSDVIGIRYRFDKKVIINHFLMKLDMQDKFEKITTKNRDDIMKIIFYRYASSTNPVIDVHLIHMAMGIWSWYWIISDTMVVTVILGITYLILDFSFKILIILLSIVVILFLISLSIKNGQCKNYAIAEVNEILDDENRVLEVRGNLINALSN